MTRRTFLQTSAGLASLTGLTGLTLATSGAALPRTPARSPSPEPAQPRAMTAAEFHASRRFADTRFGRIAYVERGSAAAPVAIFLHGLPLNGFQWRGAIARLSSQRRCLAPDFLGLGYTETRPDQDLAPVTQADMIDAVLDALSIETADVIANDSGGAVAQLIAARHPARVRTLLLTNCDAHTNSPPKAMAPELEAARNGLLAGALARHVSDKAFARSADGIGSVCFTNPASLTDEAIDCYFAPLVSSAARRAQLHGYMLAFEPNPLPAIEPALKRCAAPVRMVWGTGDKYFDVSWAGWLDRTFPRSRGVQRVEGAKLFFPEEMPDLIAEEARALWAAAPPLRR
jgi:pimeloyl-ACP methyl ester carboxylesterase